MSGMSKHARSKGWNRLRRALIIGAVGLSPVFFAVMYLSVTKLVRPSFHGWAWTVPVGTEGCFVLLYGLDLLLEWAGKPMGWLRLVPYPFAAASLWLNVYSSSGDLPGMVGHGVVTVAFFTPLIAGEAAVRRLSVTEDEARLTLALTDARQHAIDLCRDRKGLGWRFRIPSLLRRQITSGRLPDEVRSEVAAMVDAGRTSGWEGTVRAWVFRELNVSVAAAQADAQARAAIVSSALPESAPDAPERASGEESQPRSQARPEARPEPRSGPALKLAASKSRSMSASELAENVAAMLDEYGTVSEAQVRRDLHVGGAKASEALRLARKARMSSAVGASR